MLSREKVTSHGPVVRQNSVLLLNHGDEPVLVWAVRVPYCPDAAPPEASGCSGYRILSFSPRSPLGEFGSPSTACCFETETFPSSACCYRQTFLGDIETVLVPVEACIDSRSAGYSCAMAPRRLQAVLDLALAAPGARGQVESAPGVSPRAAHRTGREPLDSSGSCHQFEGYRLPSKYEGSSCCQLARFGRW